ncbi:MAG: amidohydrolase [Oscillospiraceae bacterium]|nr:amidohydrolase [Oscillospiraceae bacterium]
MSWRSCKKFDAHVHVLPDERTAQFLSNEGPGAPWAGCGVDDYLRRMDRYGIERALLLPANDQYLYDQDPNETNRFLGKLVREHPDRFWAFADVTASGAYFIEQTPYILEKAVTEYGLSGLKIHPTNLHMDADDLRLVPVLRKAAELGVPVMFHANPCRLGFHDNCAPDKINRMIQIFPDLDIITAHLGGMKWQDAVSGCTWADMSFVLPELAGLYGVEQANRILRAFGPERLIFGTDFPQGEYDAYFDLLDQMDFTGEEIDRIAWGNIEKLLAPGKDGQ